MFFGLCNSPSTFQTMMNHLFKDLISEGRVIIYLDDILIFTQTMEEHVEVNRRVLRILRENNLFLRPEKCLFHRTWILYLGLIISQNELRMDPEKVRGISEWPTPEKKRDVQSFLGFANFYRRFIEGFAKVAHPLHVLVGKKEWKWGDDQQKAFEHLKQLLTSAPILHIPNDEGPFRVEADSSDFAMGAILSQEQEGKWWPITYQSKALSKVECNYEIHDKELLAIIQALEEWSQYLKGALH